jgi:ubiquinone/menaquinone biosynthesis C-methylase UbiE
MELDTTQFRQVQRKVWSSGDWPELAKVIQPVADELVEVVDVKQGQDVLDVGTGSGNVAIRAAERGAKVTGVDITPELFDAARKRAEEAGVEIEWIEGDAQKLPFDDASFDVVTSVFGCMFVPDQRTEAQEIARVLKPGGRMALCAWTPEGTIGGMFITTAKHRPPPPEGFQPPILWGNEDHVRQLFEGTGVDLDIERTAVEFKSDSLEEFFDEMERDLPPIVASRELLEPEGKYEALREDLLALYRENNLADDGSWRSSNEYLLIKGTKS